MKRRWKGWILYVDLDSDPGAQLTWMTAYMIHFQVHHLSVSSANAKRLQT